MNRQILAWMPQRKAGISKSSLQNFNSKRHPWFCVLVQNWLNSIGWLKKHSAFLVQFLVVLCFAALVSDRSVLEFLVSKICNMDGLWNWALLSSLMMVVWMIFILRFKACWISLFYLALENNFADNHVAVQVLLSVGWSDSRFAEEQVF